MKSHRNKGFTIIELLAGMAILVIMVLFLTKVFTDSTKAWSLGTKRVEGNIAGRTAVEYMSRELAAAIFEGNLTLKLESDMDPILGYASDRIFFVTTDQKAKIKGSSVYRQAKVVSYKMASMQHPNWQVNAPLPYRYRIMRAGLEDFSKSPANTLYRNNKWWTDFIPNMPYNEVVAENVRALDFWVYDKNGNVKANYDSSVDGPPAWIDIVVEIIPDADSRKMELLPSDAARIELADRVARRYFNRVYFNNYQGYVTAQ